MKGPKKGDNIGHTDDNRNQHRIRELEQGKCNKADNADNKRIEQLAGNEPAKYPVRKTQIVNHEIRLFYG